MYIKIPKDKLYASEIIIDPITFEPCANIIIDKNYYNSIEKDYYITQITEDRSEVINHMKENYVEINPVRINIRSW